MRIALIDLGTNSVRFDVYELEVGQKPLRLHREKFMVRLGENLFLHGLISKAAAQRTIEAFASFQVTARQLDVVKIVAVATSALREAIDGDKLAQTIEKKSGISVKIISGDEEARLIAMGILANEELPSGTYGLIDVGGGSTEVSICRDREILASHSFDVGASRLHQLFLETVPPRNPDSVLKLRAHVTELAVENHLAEFSGKIKHVIGSSGTVRALAKILRKDDDRKAGFSRESLQKLIDRMSSMDSAELMAIPSMEANRVDLILAGSIILEELLEFLGATQLTISEHSLRDGLLAEELQALTEKKRPDSGSTKLSQQIRKLTPLGISPAEVQTIEKVTKSVLALRARISALCSYIEKRKIKGRDLNFFNGKEEQESFVRALAILRIIHALVDVRPMLTAPPFVEYENGALRIEIVERSLFYLRHLKLEEAKLLFQECFGVRVLLERRKRFSGKSSSLNLNHPA